MCIHIFVFTDRMVKLVEQNMLKRKLLHDIISLKGNERMQQFIEGKHASILSGAEEGRALGGNGLVYSIKSQCYV